MTVPGYERYRDSGVGWLRTVPAHWETVRLRRLVEIRKRIAGEEGPEVLSITQRGIKVRDTTSNDGQLASSYAHYQRVEPGEFAMNHMDLLTGWVDISPVHGVTSPDYRVFSVRPNAKVDSRYLLRVLQQGYIGRTFFALGQGSSHLGRWRLPADAFNDFEIALPPLEEQQAIAGFLDRETSKIDELVEAQRRLIDLLKEKRQAVISQAVTKGLDAIAPMKDSGVEWLGEVPAHWDVVPLKRHLSILSGYAFPSASFSDNCEDLPLLRGVNVGVGRLRWDETVYWPKAEAQGLDGWQLMPGDLVIGMDRPWIADGLRLAEVGIKDVPCLLLQRVAALRPSQGLDAAFLKLALQGPAFYHHCVPEMTGVSVPHISPGQVAEFVVALPPLAEQTQICEVIRDTEQRTNALVAEGEQAIALLQERRATLISAAVTGKIDVRGLSGGQTERDAA